MQVPRQSYDVVKKKWFHQYSGQKIDHHDWLHWTKQAQNWNSMCASCHSTNLQRNLSTGEVEVETADFEGLRATASDEHAVTLVSSAVIAKPPEPGGRGMLVGAASGALWMPTGAVGSTRPR